MTNDQVREILSSKGITCENVTAYELRLLHKLLSDELANSECFKGSYKMNPLVLNDDGKYMTCSANYFEEREAISFNRDGFIGFAGWASSENAKPILTAVVDWANKVGKRR